MAAMAEYPYNDYRLYIVLHKKENRRMANLVNPITKRRTTLSYSRYLMSVHLGRVLEPQEHVDHINNDKLDDRVENFQILSQLENSRKFASLNQAEVFELTCPVCGVIFSRSKQRAYQFIHFGRMICCSKKCGGIYTHRTPKGL